MDINNRASAITSRKEATWHHRLLDTVTLPTEPEVSTFHSRPLCSIASTTKQSCPSPSHQFSSHHLVPLQCRISAALAYDLQSAYIQFKLMHAKVRDNSFWPFTKLNCRRDAVFLQPPGSHEDNVDVFIANHRCSLPPGPSPHGLLPASFFFFLKDPLINAIWPDESMTVALAKMKHFCCCYCDFCCCYFPITGTSPHECSASVSPIA